MRLPAGPTIATAMVHLFFAASASAGAAAFLASSRLMAGPYGFGICANAPPSKQNTTIKPTRTFTIFFGAIFTPPAIQRATAFASQRTLDHLEIPCVVRFSFAL